jgi:hypothetical protein
VFASRRASPPTSAAYSPGIDGESWYDLGEIAQLVSRLYGQGEPITLIPFLRETDRFFGGLDRPKTVLILDHWEIKYSYGKAEAVVTGPTLRDAVDAALADLNRRADVEASQ